MICHAVLRSPSDLIAVIPYQLGFHPRESLVVAALHGERLGVLQRIDIRDGEPIAADEPPGTAELAAAAVLERESPDGVVLVCYEESSGSSDPLRRRVALRCRRAGMAVRDTFVVRDGLWARTEAASDGADLPSECWFPVPSPVDVPAIAEWIGLGVSPLPNRESLQRALLPVAGALDVARALEQERVRTAGPSRPDPVGAWRCVLGRTGRPVAVETLPARVIARAALALETVDNRDALIDWLTPGSLPATAPLRRRAEFRRRLGATPWARDTSARPGARERRSAAGGPPGAATEGARGVEELLDSLERLKGLLRRLPEAEQAPALCVLSCLAWWRGDGALARIAAERASRIDPGYPLAGLLIRIIGRGIRWQ